MIEVRFHGRGGQGAKIASRILGRSGFLSGLYVQDFALFGAERRHAPVVSFTRLSAESIDQRGHIERPNLVVMDDSLLKEASGQVFCGVQDGTPIIVNAERDQLQVHPNDFPKAKYFFLDLSGITRRLIGGIIVSAAAAAVAAKCIAAITPTALEEAVRAEISEFGLPPDIIARNIAAAREAYERAPVVNLSVPPAAGHATETAPETPPYLASSRFAGPTIRHPGSAALRETGNWRTERPVIELAKCKRCFLCYLYCPEAAMTLDAENFPYRSFVFANYPARAISTM